MEFGIGTTAAALASPFGECARPLALTERAGEGAPAWFEPDDSIDLWADVRSIGDRPVSFSGRPRELLSGHAPASSLLASTSSPGPVVDPAPLVSRAPSTPIVLPRPIVALFSDHDDAAPDAAIVALKAVPHAPVERPAPTPLVISA